MFFLKELVKMALLIHLVMLAVFMALVIVVQQN